MDLQWLTPAVEAEGPVASVTMDVSRGDASGGYEVDVRWRDLRRQLEEAGAPQEVVAAVEERITAPSGQADNEGGTGRTVVAGTGGVVLDLLLPEAPQRDEATWGPVAHLLPAIRAAAGSTRYLLVEADRQGADITVAVGSGVTAARPEGGDAVVGETSDTESTTTSGADDNIIHEVPVGGTGDYTNRHRVEDSWEHNAAAVAKDVDDLVSAHRPEVVLVTGETKELTMIREHLGERAASLLKEVPGGGRSQGVKEETFRAAIGEALAEVRAQALQELFASYTQARGKDADGADGFDAVVSLLQRGQVQEVLLRDDPSSTFRLWIGPSPLQLGQSREDLLEMGVGEPVEVRADDAIVRAVVGSSAGLTLVPGTRQDETDELELADGIGAVLRWSDQGTPGGGAPTMSGDTGRLRDVGA